MNTASYHEQLIKLERIKNDTHHALRIAVCGKFKSGKTSLLNLLLGTKLPVQSVTATGIVSKIIYGNCSLVKYIDGTISSVTPEELNKLILVASKTLEGVKLGNARVAYIGSYSKLLKRGKVEFWDTPGLEDDPELTAITMNAIDQCDLILCVMHANQVLSLYEKRLFQKLFTLMDGNIIFIVNHMDSLQAEEREQVVSTVQKMLKQYPNKFCSSGNLFFTSANPECPDIDSLKVALSQMIQNKITRKNIQKITKIGKSNVLAEELRCQIQEYQEINSQKIREIQLQIKDDIENKQKVMDEQFKYGTRDIQQAQESLKSKFLSELTWRGALHEYQKEPNWEKNFKTDAAVWLKKYILQIVKDTNHTITTTLQNCSFFGEDFAIIVDEKIWKHRYVYQKNFVRPLLFSERRFQQFRVDCVNKTIPLLMSGVINKLAENAASDISCLMSKFEAAYFIGRKNILAEKILLNSYELLQNEAAQLEEHTSKSKDLCQDIARDLKRESFRYKLVDLLSTIFPSMLSDERFS